MSFRTASNSYSLPHALSLLAAPFAISFLTVPNLAKIYSQVGVYPLSLTVCCGWLWGLSIILLVQSGRADFRLIFAIVGGLSVVPASLFPMLADHSNRIATPGGCALILGLVFLLAGASLFARSARHQLKDSISTYAVAGLLLPFFNLGLATGRPISVIAERYGSTSTASINAILIPIATGAFVGLTLRGSSIRPLWGLALGTACVAYATVAKLLGDFGAVVAWPVVIATAGIFLGVQRFLFEKRHPVHRVEIAGIILLILGASLIVYAWTLLDRGF